MCWAFQAPPSFESIAATFNFRHHTGTDPALELKVSTTTTFLMDRQAVMAVMLLVSIASKRLSSLLGGIK